MAGAGESVQVYTLVDVLEAQQAAAAAEMRFADIEIAYKERLGNHSAPTTFVVQPVEGSDLVMTAHHLRYVGEPSPIIISRRPVTRDNPFRAESPDFVSKDALGPNRFTFKSDFDPGDGGYGVASWPKWWELVVGTHLLRNVEVMEMRGKEIISHWTGSTLLGRTAELGQA